MSSSTNITPPILPKSAPSPPASDEDQVVWKTGSNQNAPTSKRSTPGSATTPISSIKESAQDTSSNQWKMTNGQIMDPTSGSRWEIADEILKLQISGGPPAINGDSSPKPYVDEPTADERSQATVDSPAGKRSSSHPPSPGHVLAENASAPHSRQSSGLTAGDDTSSSGRSSSLATPNLNKDDAAVLKPALNGVNGNVKQKDHYSPPVSAGADRYTHNGAYHVNGNGHVTSMGSPSVSTAPGGGVQSPPPFPHHIQTAVHPGHAQYSPHQLHHPPRGLTNDMHHLAQAAHHHMHAQHFDPYRNGAAAGRDDAGAGPDYGGRDGLSGLNQRAGMNGAATNGTAAPAFGPISTQDLTSQNGGALSYDPRTAYPGSPPPQSYAGHPMSPLSPTYGHLHYLPSAPHPYAAYGAAPATPTSLYELMGAVHGHEDPRLAAAVASAGRAPFRGVTGANALSGGHQHSASDPTLMRDAAAGLSGVLGGVGDQQASGHPSAAHAHSLSLSHGSPYSPQLPTSPYGAPLSPNPYQSFYAHLPPPPPPNSQAHQEVLNAMARMSPTTYAANPHAAFAAAAAAAALTADPATLALMQSGAGPSANNRKLGLYKTELCRSWEEKGSCRYGSKCQFAHGEDEIRKVARHPKYKTEICRTFWVSGSCPYGKRCCFIHTELPASGTPGAPGAQSGDNQRPGSTGANGAAGGGGGGNQSGGADGRARSMSTNSDPNDAPSSLLARISAKAHANNAARANDSGSPGAGNGNGQYGASPSEVSAAVTAAAIAQAYAQYGRPAQAALGTVASNLEIEPDTRPVPTANTSSKNASGAGTPVNAGVSTPGTTSNGMGHRISASVDFSGHAARHQTLGGDLSSLDLGGHGHHRNTSTSSIAHSYSIAQLNSRSEARLSGHSTPFGGAGESNIASSRVSPAPGGTNRFMHERSRSGGLPTASVGSSYAMDRAWAM